MIKKQGRSIASERATSRFIVVLLVAFLSSPAHPQTPAAGLEGTWILVEQTYGKGGSSLVEADEPIRLRITRTESSYSGWIWRGDNSAAGNAWPALVAGGRELRATSRSVRVEAGSFAIHARYEVVPVEGEDLVLDIHEAYTLSPDGRSLAGTVEVRFKGGDTNRGGYTLYRRFEREK